MARSIYAGMPYILRIMKAVTSVGMLNVSWNNENFELSITENNFELLKI